MYSLSPTLFMRAAIEPSMLKRAAAQVQAEAAAQAKAQEVKNISRKRVTEDGTVQYKVKFRDGSAAEWLGEGDARIKPKHVAHFEKRKAARDAGKGDGGEQEQQPATPISTDADDR